MLRSIGGGGGSGLSFCRKTDIEPVVGTGSFAKILGPARSPSRGRSLTALPRPACPRQAGPERTGPERTGQERAGQERAGQAQPEEY